MHRLKTLAQRLFDPIDIAPLVFFRVAFGVLMLWEVWRYFNYTRIERYYIFPDYNFPYYGFDWLQPLPGDGMYVLFHVLGALSVLILLGAFYRVSMTVFWVCFTYVFLLDKAQYLNHFYLVSLVSGLMIFVPAHRALSVDAWLRPSIRSQTAPNWALWLMRGQMAVVYFFGGLAKINADWFAGQPLRIWMGARTDFPLIGGLFTEEWVVFLFSWGGLLLDLFVVPLLLWRRTRILALALATLFHLLNSQLFNIGIFPWFAIAATLIFMPPAWFRVPVLFRASAATERSTAYPYGRWIVLAIAGYFAVQVLLPLRQWLYPSNPAWSEEGHTLAWRMRLRDKIGTIQLFASDPQSGIFWEIDGLEYLSARQYDQMSDNPHMIRDFAEYLTRFYPDVTIHALSMQSLNGRAFQLMVDPTADLAREPKNLLPADWILPLVQDVYPNEARPALLVSRRFDEAMLLINITDAPFALSGLSLGTGDFVLRGPDFGVDTLMPGECVLAYGPDAPLTDVFGACTEAGAVSLADWSPMTGPLSVSIGEDVQVCQSPACVVAYDDSGS